MRSFMPLLAFAAFAFAVVGCAAAEKSASKDPIKCERNPDCAKQLQKSRDCSTQCSDDPACMDRCREMSPDSLGHK